VASNEKDAPGSGQHLTQSIKGLNSCRPVKQRRALLESNPPRVSWIERRRNKKRLRIWGGQNLPKCKQRRPFISEPEHASKNSSFLFDEVAIILKLLSIASRLARPTQMGPATRIDRAAAACFWR